MICFAAVLNGSVFGDQCSPISDTTILSSLVSGCDLMQHVRTQLVPATVAGGLAMIGWCAWQLLGKVPEALQVPDPRMAATFNIGGPICASVCTVLKRA